MSQGYDKLLDLRQRPWSVSEHRPRMPQALLADLALLALSLAGLVQWLLMAWSGFDGIGSALGAGSWAARVLHGVIATAIVLSLRRLMQTCRAI